jgi:alpha-glucan,water dikinase
MPPQKASQEEILASESGLRVSRLLNGKQVVLAVGLQTDADCVLHWGLSRRPGDAWRRPPEACWPQGTAAVDGQAVRTPLAVNEKGEREVKISFPLPCPGRNLSFVLYFPRENRWVKSNGKDFSVELPHERTPSPEEALAAWVPGTEVRRQAFPLDGGGRLAAAVRASADAVRVSLACDVDAPLELHWGVAWQFRFEWKQPPEEFRPAGSVLPGPDAARTPFGERGGLRWLEWEFRKPADGGLPRGLRFVLHRLEGDAWIKSAGKDLYLPLRPDAEDPRLPSAKLRDLAEQIVGAEMGAGSWTLMHRFNLCHDLLGGAENDEEALALLFAWLRYSALRQLDWQRRYNTQPRELSHAQDRLTQRLAGIWKRQPESRLWVRRMMTTLGRGGDGQRVRDEILQIMHRNHIRETSGHFLEEWHQKLHNNTTPDDVVICEAYLVFLKSNGDRAAFDRTLEQGGVTRERLASFERPIRTNPEFLGDRKNALIGEFEHFLKILKAVHAGTDLESAAAAASGRLDEGLKGKVGAALSLRSRKAPAGQTADAVLAAREGLAGALAAAKDDAAVRDLLFLDLALEDTLRVAIERQDLRSFGRDDLVGLVEAALRNLRLSVDSQELAVCAAHWAALRAWPHEGRDRALHAKSVADRAARWVHSFSDEVSGRLQPKAEYLGSAFEAEPWVVTLFSEEVVRGGPAFALAVLLRHLDPILRREAGLGGWQVISPAEAFGRVRVIDRLLAIQGERFAEPTVIVADAVAGNEEIPEGVRAVLTSDTPDLVSHVAVRARNARVLFATCCDPDAFGVLKDQQGKTIALHVRPGGDVEYEEASAAGPASRAEKAGRAPAPRTVARRFSRWVLTHDQFTPEVVGGKANNLNGLRGRLPDLVHLPTSIALPFGVCEKTLADGANREVRREYDALVAAAEKDPAAVLPRLREAVQRLAAPAELRQSLEETWRRAGLPAVPWEQAWHAIRRVWASKWNERAFLSRRARRIPHDSLFMAVLIQQVVEAEYAFVLHTVNPVTDDRGELFAEVVLGMGETLVGNYPGRALGFVCRKADLALDLVSYPNKSVGLYGKGVIFRSDSNGEDLDDFAGAGLYDSFLAEEPAPRLLDYTSERLVWDSGFRDNLLRSVARAGLDVEKLLGSPQDVEGAIAGGRLFVVQTRPQVGLGS